MSIELCDSCGEILTEVESKAKEESKQTEWSCHECYEDDDVRLEFRVSLEVKNIIRRGAEISGLSLTNFVINAAVIKAYEIVRDHSIINANMEQMEAIVASLMKGREA